MASAESVSPPAPELNGEPENKEFVKVLSEVENDCNPIINVKSNEQVKTSGEVLKAQLEILENPINPSQELDPKVERRILHHDTRSPLRIEETREKSLSLQRKISRKALVLKDWIKDQTSKANSPAVDENAIGGSGSIDSFKKNVSKGFSTLKGMSYSVLGNSDMDIEKMVNSGRIEDHPLSISVDQKSAEYYKQITIASLTQDEDLLKSDLIKVNNSLQEMERIHHQLYYAEEQGMQEREKLSMEEREGLQMESDTAKKEVERIEREYAKAYAVLAAAKRSYDEACQASNLIKNSLSDSKNKIVEINRKFNSVSDKFRRDLMHLKKLASARRKRHLSVINRYQKEKQILLTRLEEKLVLKKSIQGKSEYRMNIISSTMDEEDETNVRPKLTTPIEESIDSATFKITTTRLKELNNSETITDVEGYSITNQKIGHQYFGDKYIVRSNLFATEGKEMHGIIIDLSRLKTAHRNHLLNNGLKITRFLRESPFDYIVNTFDVYIVESKFAYIIQEVVSQTLQQFVTEHSALDQETSSVYGRELCEAIHFLHTRGIAHQNITASNIHMEKGKIKLGAIEYATLYWDISKKKTIFQQIQKAVSEGNHLAPEVTDSSRSRYDPTKADVYSFGVLICFMLLGHYPYIRSLGADSATQWSNANDKIKNKINRYGYRLLQKCLQLEPTDRIPIQEALESKWFYPNVEQNEKKNTY